MRLGGHEDRPFRRTLVSFVATALGLLGHAAVTGTPPFA